MECIKMQQRLSQTQCMHMLENHDLTWFPIYAGDEPIHVSGIALFRLQQCINKQPLCSYTKTDLLGFSNCW